MTEEKALGLSLEFFPPHDAASHERLMRTAQQMRAFKPRYVSVTYGAGGATRAGTVNTVGVLRNMGYEVAPHLSCVGSTCEDLRALLFAYRDEGVRRLVALRGDLPSGMGLNAGELRYASELVAFIRQETGDWFHIEVAAYPEMHPQAIGPAADLEHFVRKVNAGANAAITQYFFNAAAYFDFIGRVRARGITVPIVPGVMPITNHKQLLRFSELCGAEIPRWIRLRLAEFGDDKRSLQAFGVDVVTELCQSLLDYGAPGLHFYTLNRAEAPLAVLRQLNLGSLQ
jgi:methylenetetrahydrofolate reductase (NADPH)